MSVLSIPASAQVITGLDHVPVAVKNLDSAASRYRALGFALKPGRLHDNGIRNLHVKFKDGTELELITAAEPRDALTREYRQHLAAGEGPAFLALYTPEIPALINLLKRLQQPFEVEDGFPAVPAGNPLHYLFFGRRNQSPTDQPAHFAHENSAESLIGVWIATNDSLPLRNLLQEGGALIRKEQVGVPQRQSATVAYLKEGTVVLLPVAQQVVSGHPVIGVTLRVKSIEKVKRVLKNNNMNIPATIAGNGSLSLLLSPSQTCGLWLEFRQIKK
ncbi:VOC family protein [Chitinophaga flava]|nr:VOC family protein [Chitinophaga flava]